MTTRNIQNIVLVDEDSNLPVDKAMVHDFGNIMTEDDQQTTIIQLMVDNDMREILEQHNKVRTSTVNQTVLEKTGRKVNLRPITIKDLAWKIR